MPTPIAGSTYIVQPGDNLTSIAQQAYGDGSLWPEIFNANIQVIGNNPDVITAGMKLYIMANPQRAQVYLTTQSCTVTVPSLHIRARPTAESTITASQPQGTVLNFTEVIESETVSGISHWARTAQGQYFWMGGTNRQNG